MKKPLFTFLIWLFLLVQVFAAHHLFKLGMEYDTTGSMIKHISMGSVVISIPMDVERSIWIMLASLPIFILLIVGHSGVMRLEDKSPSDKSDKDIRETNISSR